MTDLHKTQAVALDGGPLGTYRAECTCGWVSEPQYMHGARYAGYDHEIDMEEEAPPSGWTPDAVTGSRLRSTPYYEYALAAKIRAVIDADVDYIDEFDLCVSAVRACEPIIQGYAIRKYAAAIRPTDGDTK